MSNLESIQLEVERMEKIESDLYTNDETFLDVAELENSNRQAEQFASDHIDGFVRNLATVRGELETTKDNEKTAYGFLEVTPEFIAWDSLKSDRMTLATIEKRVKELVGSLAKTLFSFNQNTKPHSAIVMKKYKTSTITDMSEAVEWCKINAAALIVTSVDEKALDKFLQAIPEEKRPDWYEYGEEYRPTVASDLTKHVDMVESPF